MKRIIVLLSGGLDSSVVLAAALRDGQECSALAFDYGQRHIVELESAETIAEHFGVPFEVKTILGMGIAKIDDVVFAGRNLLLAAWAVSIAQARGLDAIALGCNGSDWVRFPDCRPSFWGPLRDAAQAAYGITVMTPLLHASKIDVVRAARDLGVPIERTWSCYEPIMDPEHGDHQQCGRCLACKVRNEALAYEPAI